MPEPEWQERFVQANGVRFHLVEAGEGPLMMLLHGFPESWYSWRHQIPKLATAFHVVAPDLRGYNETSKPADGYDIRTLGEDVVSLARELGHDRFRLVGHDWGGVIAWAVAGAAPRAVERLSILNAPHPTLFRRTLTSSLTQLRRSWYIFAFQVPGLGERLIRRHDFARLDRMLRGQMVHPGRISDEDLAHFRTALARPGALEAALEYYRQAFRGALRDGLRAPRLVVRAPTQVIWGECDFALGVELLDGLEELVPDLEVVRIPTSGHWVQQDEPDLVTEHLLRFHLG